MHTSSKYSSRIIEAILSAVWSWTCRETHIFCTVVALAHLLLLALTLIFMRLFNQGCTIFHLFFFIPFPLRRFPESALYSRLPWKNISGEVDKYHDTGTGHLVRRASMFQLPLLTTFITWGKSNKIIRCTFLGEWTMGFQSRWGVVWGFQHIYQAFIKIPP